jgi:hypothetical protein
MSRWIDRILQEFPQDLSRFWIAADPDDLLLDERVLSSLRERGFELLPFEDPIAFRTEYEERYRAAWARGVPAPSGALILHLRGTEVDALPWDYLRTGRRTSLSLANLFPNLSYSVVRQIGSEYYEGLFEAQGQHNPQSMGDGATKDFILTHIFRISPYLISRPEDLWRELLRLHYRGDGLPPVLASHVATVLGAKSAFGTLPIGDLFSSKSFLLRVVQSAWDHFLALKGVTGSRAADVKPPEEIPDAAIPFEHPDVRVIVDSMFLEGMLQPLEAQERPEGFPDWARVGIVDDPNALEKLVIDGAQRLAAELPSIDASFRDWLLLSRRLGEIIYRFHGIKPDRAETIGTHVTAIQKAADEHLRAWVTRHYADLPSLPAAKSPVMVHHVPRYISLRHDPRQTRVALLVFDGMAMDQWIQIRESVAQRALDLSFEEGACFAWLPTLTSVSRQALFSGMRPREFANSIDTTSQEPALWLRYWQDHGLRANEVFFRKAIQRTAQLPELATAISSPTTRVAGIVIDTIDEIVHGAVLGKRGIANQIAGWCETGFVERLFNMLLDRGFHVYVTADHGNVDVVGVGRPNQGAVSETRGERVRTYRSEILAEFLPAELDAFRLDIAGLPAEFLPLYAGTRGAFIRQGEAIVAHGGISVEELIVPFVKVSRAGIGT